MESGEIKLEENIKILGIGYPIENKFLTTLSSSINFYPSGDKDAAIVFFTDLKEIHYLVIPPFGLNIKYENTIIENLENAEEEEFFEIAQLQARKFLSPSDLIRSNNSGFTLLEVLIAITIFAFFSAAYLVTQGNNLSDSKQMRRETNLESIAVKLVNEIIVSPPEFSPSLLINPEGAYKKYEEDSAFEYRVEWSEFKIPDFNQLQGNEEGDDSSSNSQSLVQKSIFDNIKNNLEKIWQLKVIVREADTKFSFDLSTWVLDPKYKVQFTGISGS